MKTCSCVFLALLLVSLASGCASRSSSPAAPKALVTVRIPDGGAPSQEQIADAYALIAPTLLKGGMRFARTAADADYVVSVLYGPAEGENRKADVSIVAIDRLANTGRSASQARAADMWQVVRSQQQWAERQAPDPR